MNHLRELLETIQEGLVVVDPHLDDATVDDTLDAARHNAEQAMCFDMGDCESIVGMRPVPEICRLPFQCCWFEGENFAALGGKALMGLLAHEADDKSVSVACFIRLGPVWGLMWIASTDSLAGHEFVLSSGIPDVVADAQYAMYVMRAFCSAINCINVKRQEHARPAKLQKARAKRGKQPLFSYWTLRLDGKSDRGDDYGGTHASPRVHLRRGHPRQYTPGKWTWVQAHAVGNKSLGVVHKDYTAGPALLVPAR